MEILQLVLIFVVTISLAITYENIIPLTVTGTRKVRVYCFSDDSNGVSFTYSKLCSKDCGYFTRMNSCCLDIEIIKNRTIAISCYRGGLVITVYITSIETDNNVFKIDCENKTILECLENTNQSKYISDHLFENELFYIQWAYLSKEDNPTDYQTFQIIKKLALPASGEILLCNNTKYQYRKVCDDTKNLGDIKFTIEEIDKLLKELNQRLKIIYRVCCYVLVVLYVIITSSIIFLVMRDLSQIKQGQVQGFDREN